MALPDIYRPMPTVQQPQPQQGFLARMGQKMPGILGGFGNRLSDNSGLLTALGSTIFAYGENPVQNPLSNLGYASMQGRQVDQGRADQRREREQQAAQQNATIQWLMQNKGMNEQEAQAAVTAGGPVLSSYFKESLNPSDRYKVVDNQLVDISGDQPQWVPAPGDAGGGSLFSGDSVEAQGLNLAVQQGQLTEQQAALWAANGVQVVVDPVLRSPMLVNKATQQSIPLSGIAPQGDATAQPPLQGQGPQTGPQPNEQAQAPSLYEMAPGATGVGPSLQETWTDIGPQVSENFEGYPDVVEARQQFSVAQNELIRALSLNPRFPVAEMERIRSEINIGPSAWQSPQALQARMRAVDAGLRIRLQNEMETANNPNLPADVRSAALQAVNDIQNFLERLGAPQGGEQRSPVGPQPGDVEDGYRFKGGNPGDSDNWERVQ